MWLFIIALFGLVVLSYIVSVALRLRRWPPDGLGDVIAVMVDTLGLDGWSDCDCRSRRVRWNRRWPFARAYRAQISQLQRRLILQEDFIKRSEELRVAALELLSRLHRELDAIEYPWYRDGELRKDIRRFLREQGQP